MKPCFSRSKCQYEPFAYKKNIHQLIRHLHVVRAVLSQAPAHTCLLRNSDFNKYESNSIVQSPYSPEILSCDRWKNHMSLIQMLCWNYDLKMGCKYFDETNSKVGRKKKKRWQEIEV